MLQAALMDAPANRSSPSTLRPACESDWSAFADAYGWTVVAWFRQSGLPVADSTRLARELLTTLRGEFTKVATEASLKFRPWLQYAGHLAWCRLMDCYTEQADPNAASPIADFLLSTKAHDDFLKLLDAECTHQRRRDLLVRIQGQVDPLDWDVFYRSVLLGMADDAVAAEFQGTPAAARAAAYRVHRALTQELQQMDERY